MSARELFGVGVRWIGLIAAIVAVPQMIGVIPNLQSAAQLVLGLLLLTKADLVASYCYPRTRAEILREYESRD